MSRAGMALACVLAIAAGGASAQQATTPAARGARVFEQGPMVVISEVRVLPGNGNAYAQQLAGSWRTRMEAAKRRGEVLEYRVYNNVHRRDGEGEFLFIITYRDASVLDIGLEARDRQAVADAGSAVAAPTPVLREVMSETMLRELVFKDPPATGSR